jgi:hypothetical protein
LMYFPIPVFEAFYPNSSYSSNHKNGFFLYFYFIDLS